MSDSKIITLDSCVWHKGIAGQVSMETEFNLGTDPKYKPLLSIVIKNNTVSLSITRGTAILHIRSEMADYLSSSDLAIRLYILHAVKFFCEEIDKNQDNWYNVEDFEYIDGYEEAPIAEKIEDLKVK